MADLNWPNKNLELASSEQQSFQLHQLPAVAMITWTTVGGLFRAQSSVVLLRKPPTKIVSWKCDELNKGLSFKDLQILHQDYACHVVLCPCCSLINIFCTVPVLLHWLQQSNGPRKKQQIFEIAVLSALLDAFPAICSVARLVPPSEIVDSIISFEALACPSCIFQKYVHLSMKIGD